ncbi:glycosyltransferase [Prevotella disiens]
MKVVHVSVADTGGAGLCAYRICKAQREIGIDAQLVVLYNKQKESFVHKTGGVTYFLHSSLRKIKKLFHIADEVNMCRALGKQNGAAYTLPLSPIDITKLDVVKNADIVHLHWIGGFLDYPSFFAKMSNKTIVCTLHDQSILYGIASIEQQYLPDNELEKKYYKLKYEEMSKVEHFGAVFLSKMSFASYSVHEMLNHAKKTIIYNMVDGRLFKPFPKEQLRQQLSLPNTKLFSFCAYDINDARKGLAVLSEALMRIDSSYRILAIGKNRKGSKWANVIEMGFFADATKISAIHSVADFCCMPSYKEHFAQAPLEAMACGTPVIAFPCSGTEELITPQNGIRCTDFTLEALEEGIRKALQTEYNSDEIRQDMLNRYAPEKIAKDYLAFYETL